MLFGNLTETHEVPREDWVNGPFRILLEAIEEKTGEQCEFVPGYPSHFSNGYFTIRPYCWDFEDENEAQKPNFEIPAENFRLTWYKYPFRGSYSSEKLSPKRWNFLIQSCILSLGAPGKLPNG